MGSVTAPSDSELTSLAYLASSPRVALGGRGVQSPLNAIWEGSGNVIALDIVRAVGREPDCVTAVLAELEASGGLNNHYDAYLRGIKNMLGGRLLQKGNARAYAQDLGLGLQAAALHWSAPAPLFDGFCSQRLNPQRRGFLYGDLDDAVNEASLLERTLALIDVFPD